MTRDLQILKAAADLFADRGYAAVGVDDIGAAANLTGPAIYRHFKGKGEVLAALFDQTIDRVLIATANTISDPFEDLEHRVRAHAQFVLDEPRLTSVWIREIHSLSEEHRMRIRRREASYVSQWVDCIERCYPDMNHLEAEVAALAVLGALNSISRWSKGLASLANIDDFISGFVLKGLKP